MLYYSCMYNEYIIMQQRNTHLSIRDFRTDRSSLSTWSANWVVKVICKINSEGDICKLLYSHETALANCNIRKWYHQLNRCMVSHNYYTNSSRTACMVKGTYLAPPYVAPLAPLVAGEPPQLYNYSRCYNYEECMN